MILMNILQKKTINDYLGKKLKKNPYRVTLYRKINIARE